MTTTPGDSTTTYAAAWRPDVGQAIDGIIVAADVITREDNMWPVLTVRETDGTELAIHAFGAVLRREIAKHEPKLGERIRIVYEGEGETRAGRPLHAYKVTMPDRPAAGIDWRQFMDPADAAAAAARAAEHDAPPLFGATPADRPAAPAHDDDIPF